MKNNFNLQIVRRREKVKNKQQSMVLKDSKLYTCNQISKGGTYKDNDTDEVYDLYLVYEKEPTVGDYCLVPINSNNRKIYLEESFIKIKKIEDLSIAIKLGARKAIKVESMAVVIFHDGTQNERLPVHTNFIPMHTSTFINKFIKSYNEGDTLKSITVLFPEYCYKSEEIKTNQAADFSKFSVATTYRIFEITNELSKSPNRYTLKYSPYDGSLQIAAKRDDNHIMFRYAGDVHNTVWYRCFRNTFKQDI